MEKLRLAIIGTGGISNSHVRAYKQMEDVEIVAGADIIPGKAREALDRWEFPEAKAYEDTEKMLSEVKPDAVSVCTYNTAHAVCAAAAGGVASLLNGVLPAGGCYLVLLGGLWYLCGIVDRSDGLWLRKLTGGRY